MQKMKAWLTKNGREVSLEVFSIKKKRQGTIRRVDSAPTAGNATNVEKEGATGKSNKKGSK